jgi:hypothetical protein
MTVIVVLLYIVFVAPLIRPPFTLGAIIQALPKKNINRIYDLLLQAINSRLCVRDTVTK